MSLSLWIGILIGILAFSLRKDGQAFWPSLDEEPGVPPTPDTPETPRMEDVEFHNPYEPEEDV